MTAPPDIRPGSRVAIVGAGVVGAACAFELSRRGYRVTLVDQTPPGEFGASRANAGHIAGSDILPLSTPGIELVALRMLADGDGPLKMPPGEMVRLIPWMWRFWKTSRGRAHAAAREALSRLCRTTLDETEAALAAIGLAGSLQRKAAVYLYESERSYRASLAGWGKKAEAGHGSTRLSQGELRDLLPALAPCFTQGVLSHDWAMVSDPLAVVRGFVAAAGARGAQVLQQRVDRVHLSDATVELALDGRPDSFEAVLIAAGVWSRGLAAELGEHLPLEAERGYNLTYPAPGVVLDHPLVFADRGIVATQLAGGLRIGGWAEYAGTKRPPRRDYFARLRRINATLVPGLDQTGAVEWMGHRPSLPDSVPLLSRSAVSPRLFYACGHGHYGLTHAAVSARIMAELISGEAREEDYAGYSLQRFR
jgi:D-amino-acid dehydrogenase